MLLQWWWWWGYYLCIRLLLQWVQWRLYEIVNMNSFCIKSVFSLLLHRNINTVCMTDWYDLMISRSFFLAIWTQDGGIDTCCVCSFSIHWKCHGSVLVCDLSKRRSIFLKRLESDDCALSSESSFLEITMNYPIVSFVVSTVKTPTCAYICNHHVRLGRNPSK